MVGILIKDMAAARGCGESTIIETLLTEQFLPKNQTAKSIVERCLYAEDGSIEKTLHAIFQMNTAGHNGKSKYDNLYPLLDFMILHENETWKTFSPSNNHYFIEQWSCIVEILEANAQEIGAYGIKEAKEILEVLTKTPEYLRLHDFFYILTNCWCYLNDKSRTYRFLMDLSQYCHWENSAENRVRLLSIITDMAKGWD